MHEVGESQEVEGVPHPFFGRRLRRHADAMVEHGLCTEQDAAKIRQLCDHPTGKDKDGNIVHGLERLRLKVAEMVEADESLPKGVRLGAKAVGFDWDFHGAWEWFKTHWLTILQAAAAILSIMFLFI